MTPTDPTRLDAQLRPLQLPYIRRDYLALASKAAEQQRSRAVIATLGDMVQVTGNGDSG